MIFYFILNNNAPFGCTSKTCVGIGAKYSLSMLLELKLYLDKLFAKVGYVGNMFGFICK